MDHITNKNPMKLYGALIAAGDAVPAYVLKTASYTEESVQNLHSKYFADPVNRELPIHTKAATYLSAAYFYATLQKDKGIEANIKRAVTLFNIEDDVSKVKEASAPHIAQEPVYAIMLENPRTSELEGVFRIDTPDFLIKSAHEMVESYAHQHISGGDFVKAARVIFPLAEISGVSDLLPEDVVNAGIIREPNFKIARAVAYKQAGGDKDIADALEDIIKTAETMYEESIFDTAVIDKWAHVWECFTKEAGLTRIVGMNPYVAFFSGEPTESVEKQASTFVVIQDVLIPHTVIKEANTKLIDVAFSKADAESIKTACAAETSNDSTKAFCKLGNKLQKRFLKHLAENAK